MPEHDVALPLPLPPALWPWIALNAEFNVLVCVGNGCQHALSRHLRDKHRVDTHIRRQVDEYT